VQINDRTGHHSALLKKINAMLHTINKSPAESNKFASCLKFVQAGHSVLLLENAVYAALADSEFVVDLKETSSSITFYVLTPDLAARGLLNKPIHPEIKQVDYNGFVQLVTENDVVQSW
jgi:tRNA 2-thiouridine synthesizing protein B